MARAPRNSGSGDSQGSIGVSAYDEMLLAAMERGETLRSVITF